MVHSRTAFSAALLSALWLLPVPAHAGDVTVDYSQLDRVQNDMPPADIVTEDLSPKTPIHLHPLVAITSPTVKNLAAAAPKSEIHLHPPAPKFVAATPPPQNPNQPMLQSIAAPVTTIDLAMAAVPVAPKPVEAPKPEVAAAVPSEAAPVAEPPTPKTETAAAPVTEPVPAAPTPQDKMAVAEPIVPPPAPQKPADNPAPGFIPVRDVVSKTDDLRPEDVVGLDLGPPQKTTDN